MSICSIFSYDIGISLSSNANFDVVSSIRSSKPAKIFIPGIRVENFKDHLDFEIEHIQSINPSIKKVKNKIFIYDNWKDHIPTYIYFFLYKIFDYLYQKKKMISFHSSAISFDNKGILLVGETGDGKTNTMLESVLNHNAGYLSNNRTTLQRRKGEIFITGGTNVVSLRVQDVYRYPQLKKYITSNETFSFNPEIAFNIQDIGIQPESLPIPLNFICLVKIDGTSQEFLKVDSFSSIIHLYNNASLTSWGECLLFDGKTCSPRFESSLLAQRRLDFIKFLVKKYPVYSIRGSKCFICEKIMEIKNGYQIV